MCSSFEYLGGTLSITIRGSETRQTTLPQRVCGLRVCSERRRSRTPGRKGWCQKHLVAEGCRAQTELPRQGHRGGLIRSDGATLLSCIVLQRPPQAAERFLSETVSKLKVCVPCLNISWEKLCNRDKSQTISFESLGAPRLTQILGSTSDADSPNI